MQKPRRILVVDDDKKSRRAIKEMVESLGHEPVIARSGVEALEKIGQEIDLVLLDILMPGPNGYNVARRIRMKPETNDMPIIMITGLGNFSAQLHAAQSGADAFITKPVDIRTLRARTRSLLRITEATDALKQHEAEYVELGRAIENKNADLRRRLEEMSEAHRKSRTAHLETIQCLAVAAEFKDKGSGSHVKRMSRYSSLLARKLTLPPGEVLLLRHASAMHDVGKIRTPDSVLLKPGKLNYQEWNVMKQHTVVGGTILSGSSSDVLQAGEVIALSHHEKWDSSGYPKGLAGEEIPLWGRICAVADVFDALTSNRPYKKPFSNEKAFRILHEGKDKHFDPNIVELFLESTDEVVAIQEKYSDKQV